MNHKGLKSFNLVFGQALNDWCTAVALTTESSLVLIEEYRHAAGEVVSGLPSGIIEQGEAPRSAMIRELLEETGLGGGAWFDLPAFWSNPAVATNTCHGFLAVGVHATGRQSLDPGETIDVIFADPSEAIARLTSGQWRSNGLHAATLLLAREYARRELNQNPAVAGLVSG